MTKSLLTKGMIALFVAGTALLTIGCNVGDKSALRVAGGKFDDNQKYPGTVYAEMRGTTFGNQEAVIRNVGTIVDIGLSNHYALILSLADVFQSNGGKAVLPAFKSIKMRLFLSNGTDPIDIPAVQINQDGILEDGNKRKYHMFAVGVKVEQTGSVDRRAQEVVSRLSPQLFSESPLITEKGLNLRDANTSFIMFSIPKSAHPAIARLKAPRIIAAEDREAAATLKATVVGFGENTVGGSRKNEFSLSDELPKVLRRNYAPVIVLNKSASEFTPLRQLIGSASSVANQIWEFSGSGLCSAGDTGAALYDSAEAFIGFGVRSTAKSTGYKGKLNCGLTDADDMVTMVVSLTREHISQFISRVGL